MFSFAMKSGKLHELVAELQANTVLSARCRRPGDVRVMFSAKLDVLKGPDCGLNVASPNAVSQLTGSFDRI
jgi:hypothetical protein